MYCIIHMLYITIQGKQVFLSLKANNYNHFKLQETLIQAKCFEAPDLVPSP